MTVTDFLLARIAEDEAVARELLTHQPKGPWMDTLEDLTYEHDHFANWNPDRVIAECAAKRAIVQMALDSERYGCGTVTDGVKRETLGLAVSALAAVYADHPDYLPEWAL